MDARLREYLRQLETAAEESRAFVAGMSDAEFRGDTKTQRAVTMSLVILGSVAAKIEERFPEFAAAHPEVAWTAIRGMRNRIAHEYFALNFETIWATVEIELPRFLEQVRAATGEEQ